MLAVNEERLSDDDFGDRMLLVFGIGVGSILQHSIDADCGSFFEISDDEFSGLIPCHDIKEIRGGIVPVDRFPVDGDGEADDACPILRLF